MKRALPAPTYEQQCRFAEIKRLGCVCCTAVNGSYAVPDIHHLTTGGFTTSHDDTIGLCKWHHVGNFREGWNERMMVDVLGPSLARSSKKFHEVFGSNADLLEYQNSILRKAATTALPHGNGCVKSCKMHSNKKYKAHNQRGGARRE